ncbi:MAG: DUF427 domain-containing protein [Thermoleophilaceae bacterium]|jgi:uncharacterized protein (DUF427 family)|nr:DUF427 domain-containing protein [Thermoleophilaceae bacterium]
MKAVWNGVTVAESDETIVVEGNHYFPPDTVKREHLSRTRMRTLCPWKGLASYYSLDTGGETNRYGAWSYPHPWPWIRKIRGHVAFSPGVEVRR